jgi:hypothetical protein
MRHQGAGRQIGRTAGGEGHDKRHRRL